jgi:hypothetical protein
MPKTKIERTGSFLVTEVEAPHRQHLVEVFRKFVLTEFLAEPPVWLPSTRAHRLQNGDHLNPLSDGTFECVRTGVRFKAEVAATTM